MQLNRFCLAYILFSLAGYLLLGCATNIEPTPFPSLIPPSFIDSSPISDERSYIVIQINSLMLLQSGGDPNIELRDGTEFKLITVAADGSYSSASVGPSEGFLSTQVGESINPGPFATIAFEETAMKDQVYIYFLGVDSDEFGTGNAFAEIVAGEVANAFSDLVAQGSSIGGAIFPAIIPVASQTISWLSQDDIVGEVSFILNRNSNWNVGNDFSIITGNGNLKIDYSIVRASNINQNIIVNPTNSGSSTDTERTVNVPTGYQRVRDGDEIVGTLLKGKEQHFFYYTEHEVSNVQITVVETPYDPNDLPFVVLQLLHEDGTLLVEKRAPFLRDTIELDFFPVPNVRYLINMTKVQGAGTYRLTLAEIE